MAYKESGIIVRVINACVLECHMLAVGGSGKPVSLMSVKNDAFSTLPSMERQSSSLVKDFVSLQQTSALRRGVSVLNKYNDVSPGCVSHVSGLVAGGGTLVGIATFHSALVAFVGAAAGPVTAFMVTTTAFMTAVKATDWCLTFCSQQEKAVMVREHIDLILHAWGDIKARLDVGNLSGENMPHLKSDILAFNQLAEELKELAEAVKTGLLHSKDDAGRLRALAAKLNLAQREIPEKFPYEAGWLRDDRKTSAGRLGETADILTDVARRLDKSSLSSSVQTMIDQSERYAKVYATAPSSPALVLSAASALGVIGVGSDMAAGRLLSCSLVGGSWTRL